MCFGSHSEYAATTMQEKKKKNISAYSVRYFVLCDTSRPAGLGRKSLMKNWHPAAVTTVRALQTSTTERHQHCKRGTKKYHQNNATKTMQKLLQKYSTHSTINKWTGFTHYRIQKYNMFFFFLIKVPHLARFFFFLLFAFSCKCSSLLTWVPLHTMYVQNCSWQIHFTIIFT